MTDERGGSSPAGEERLDFIREIVAADAAAGTTIHTRFPPEPNGYLHIGHAKAICLDFGVAEEYGGVCNLRFDDTNPAKEETEFVEAMQEDIHWLGFDWGDRLFHASDWFEKLYATAESLIERGLAYVDELTAEEIREHRGTLTEPGKDSPWRDRPTEESLDLFRRMRAGEFAEGSHVLRARIDMASANINLRDPVLYRIVRKAHHRVGEAWSIYPMYDYAHALSDAFEGITHSLCTLEFEDHRPLYDWIVAQAGTDHVPRQIEFAPLNLTYTVLSKRKLKRLVDEGHVGGWDDPRMPTLRGLRRKGVTAEAIRDLMKRVGVAKRDSQVDWRQLEFSLREHLNRVAPRRMAVLRPLKVVLTNYPDDGEEWLEAINNPEDESAGTRKVPFSRELWIEQEDFLEDPPKKFFRLGPGREVRLKHAYFITCDEVVKDDAGNVVELRCTYDPATRGGDAPDGRRVKGTLHWVSARHAAEAEIRLYDHLFAVEDPAAAEDFHTVLRESSLESLPGARVEPALVEAPLGEAVQFLRQGYFARDPDSTPEHPVFNRTVSLKDSWARIAGKG